MSMIVPEGNRRSDGGTYLVIADTSSEFDTALAYAAHMAQAHRGHLAVAHIIEPPEFTGWSTIDQSASAQMRTRGEQQLNQIAERVKDKTGITPSLILREGYMKEEIVAIARSNPSVCAIVLAASIHADAQNPLIAYFTARGIAQIEVPVIVVPGHIGPERAEKLL